MLKVKKDIEKRSLILSVLLVFILSLFYFFFNKKIMAEIVYFYPESCLGSFVNPEKAEGKPEVENSDLISESNSAVYLGGLKEIYCGNFQGPIEEGEIQNITLKFNMVLTKERREKPIIQSTSSESLIEKILPPKTIEIINTSTENSTTTAPENPPTSTIEIPQSFFYKMVFAEETTNQESTSSNENLTSEQTSETQTTEEIINTTTQETVITTQELSTTTQEITTTQEEKTSTTQLEQTLNYFDIFYTLDGQTWQYLGSITNKNSQDISFSIPVNDWLMISKIQIKVQSNPTIENIPYLYLESMSLEVEYNKKSGKESHEEEIKINKFPEIENFDFNKLEIEKIKGISPTDVLIFVFNKETKENELLLVNIPNKTIKQIASGIISPSDNSIIASKENFVFWINEEESLIFAADYKNTKIYKNQLPQFDKSKGERATISFREITYEVIYDGHNLYFKDNIHGEVFSDDYSLVLEDFRKNFNLDRFLTKEKLEQLGFVTEEQ
ncbi:MAG: hypothetical protein QXF76_04820 [Candidatus Anstonellales archaeon]